jgi:hypothetical protein
LADLDGDGRLDLLTGSFDGGAWWIQRQPDGSFAKPQPVLDTNGNRLRVGQYWHRPDDGSQGSWQLLDRPHGIAAAPMDWNGNGRADLVLGTGCGKLFVALNEGGEEGPRFNPALVPVEVGGATLELASGYAMPYAVDWDGDGRLDLLVGVSSGEVHWLRNVGAADAPSFEAPRTLLAASSGEWDAPGRRVQVSAADVDGDGRLDLLVGDYLARKEGDSTLLRGHVWWLRRLP